MAYRAVMFWVMLVYRLVIWGLVVGVGVWVWQRGVEGFVEDVKGLGEVWAGEYQRFSGEVKAYQSQKEQQIRMDQNKGRRGWR